MVLCRRQIPSLHRLMPEFDTSNLPPEQVCQYTNQARLAGVMSQLAMLTDYATEVFTNIIQDANGTHNRIQDLANRTSNLQKTLPNTRNYYADKAVLDKMNKQVRTAFSSQQAEERELVTHESRPVSMMRAYNSCEPPPNFLQFQSGESALKLYTNPQYFIEQWVSEQRQELAVLKAERKKRRKEKAEARRMKRKAEEQAKALPKIQRIQYDPATGKAIDVGMDGMDVQIGQTDVASEKSDDTDEGVRKITVSEVHKVRQERKELTKNEQPTDWFGEAPTVIQQPEVPQAPADDVSSVVMTPPPVPRRRNVAPSIPSDFEQPILSSPVSPVLPPESLRMSASSNLPSPVSPVLPPEEMQPNVPLVEPPSHVVQVPDVSPSKLKDIPAEPPATVYREPSLHELPQVNEKRTGPPSVTPPPPPPPPSIVPERGTPMVPVSPPIRKETKPIVVETSALLEQIRSGIQKTKLTHVERNQPQQQQSTKNSYGFNSDLVGVLLRLRKDVDDSSSSLSEGWDDDEDSDET